MIIILLETGKSRDIGNRSAVIEKSKHQIEEKYTSCPWQKGKKMKISVPGGEGGGKGYAAPHKKCPRRLFGGNKNPWR